MSDDLDQRLQKAAELRLEQAGWIFSKYEYEETIEDLEITQEQLDEAERALAGPYDGCETCIVREVLDAAFAVIRALTPEEQAEFARGLWASTATIDGHPNVALIGRM